MAAEAPLTVEVVYALPDRQVSVAVRLPAGATADDAVNAAGIEDCARQIDLAAAPVGIFGRLVPRDTILHEGDRIEIYRPLVADPRLTRRRKVDGRR